ncbi:Lysophospholipid acyltransferase [Collariella sp. IMI 366227]|nr:Lysophospholipid acyltransferase [Collariella sp. IMI 366227]
MCPGWAEDTFVYLSAKLGAGPDELRFSISIFYLVGLFDLWDGLRTMLISAGGAYAIAKFLRGSRYMPWLGFVFLMGHMSVNHIVRQVTNNPKSVDITGAQMVLVMKLSSFCWNVADGLLPEEDLSDFQKDRRLTELPSLLDYAGFVFFFPSMLVGPAFDFAEYRRWLDTTMFDVPSTVDPAKKPPTRRKRKIPRSGTPAMINLVTALIWIFSFLKLSSHFHHTVLLEDSYLEYGFLKRLFVLHMVGFTARTKFYGVWTLSEGACILAGLGYNGVDPLTGKVSWDRLRNIDPWGVELAQNTRGYLESWNINTNKWLRNCVYLRVTPKGKKPGFRASLATFATSAFWHGFYPGYYLAFIFASFIQTVAKKLRRNLRPFFLDPKTGAPLPSKKFYDIASWLTTQLTFSFAVVPFLVLGFSDSLLAWSRLYFYAVIGTFSLLAFFASPAQGMVKRELQKRDAKAGVVSKGKGDGKGPKIPKSPSTDSLVAGEPIMGITPDLDVEFDEAMRSLRSSRKQRER